MGWNRPTEAPKVAPKKPSAMRGIAAGLVAVAVAAVCIVIFMGKGEKSVEKAEKKPSQIKAVTPAPAPRAQPEMPTNKQEVVKKTKTGGTPEWVIKEFNRKKQHVVITNNSAVAGKPTHRNSVEHLMLMIFGTELGSMPPPLPTLSKKSREKLVEKLLDKNEVLEDDTPEVKEEKMILAEAKKELMQYIKDGGDVDGFFSHYHSELETAYRLRRDTMKIVLEAQRGEHPEDAQGLLDAANEKLKARGIKRVKLPGLTTKED